MTKYNYEAIATQNVEAFTELLGKLASMGHEVVNCGCSNNGYRGGMTWWAILKKSKETLNASK